MFRGDDPAGPLGVFLARLAERISEDRVERLRLVLRNDTSRFVIQALWTDPRGTVRAPSQLLPDVEGLRLDTGDRGGEMNIEMRGPSGLGEERYQGWFVALPVEYEGYKGQRVPRPPQIALQALSAPVVLVNDDPDELAKWSSYFKKAVEGIVEPVTVGSADSPGFVADAVIGHLGRLPEARVIVDLQWGDLPRAGARLLYLLRARRWPNPILVLTRAHFGQAAWRGEERSLPPELGYAVGHFPSAEDGDVEEGDVVPELRRLLGEAKPVSGHHLDEAEATARKLLEEQP